MQPTSPTRLILGSSSVYRQALLARLQLPFDVLIPAIDETPQPHESPTETALRLARVKAESIAGQVNGPALIIASDQVATVNDVHIGKPGNHARALAQLQMMRGRTVVFHSALCLLDTRAESTTPVQIDNIQTIVTFRALPDAELDAYLRREQPYDCAGSAKNEGLGIALIESIVSTDPTALTGLPLISLTSMLRLAGVAFFGAASP